MERGKRKARTGVVVSDKMQKTVVVRVERTYRHPLYKKVMLGSKKFKVHDEKNESKIGDMVEIEETRPISRDKRWRLVKVLGKSRITAHEYPKGKEKEDVSEVSKEGES